ncbi:thioesterase family protein [Streptomyces sp. BHT-5-2]|uniref:thioesterase family protein n=1 Tax=Streptomyces sp. BHT-5-2 TaxID=2866715 RepID=UPI0021B127AC|nr:thioesterase family protein [Streptomyces sp. BHT-5-2]
MLSTLQPGARHELKFQVPLQKTVPFLYPESREFLAVPPVFATGFMVGLMEWACLDALRPHLQDGEGSLGTGIEVSHCAATLPGMTVTVVATCMKIERSRVTWNVEAHDDMDLIGSGEHQRTVISLERFRSRLDDKAAACHVPGMDEVEQSIRESGLH